MISLVSWQYSIPGRDLWLSVINKMLLSLLQKLRNYMHALKLIGRHPAAGMPSLSFFVGRIYAGEKSKPAAMINLQRK